MNNVNAIWKAICDSYNIFVTRTAPLYLIMDDADDHGTLRAKADFVNHLKNVYIIWVNWKVPNSLDINMLDLGV